MKDSRERLFPTGKAIDIFKGRDVVAMHFIGEGLKLLCVGVFAAGVKDSGFIFAELVEQFGFSNPPSAVQNDELGFVRTVGVIEVLQLTFASDKHKVSPFIE